MHKISTSNKRIAKNTLFLYIRMVFVLLVSLYSTRAILNALGVVDYGIYNVVAGFVVMFAFLNSSMINTVQRFFNFPRGEENKDNLNKIYITSVQIQIALSFITVILLEVLGIWYINSKMIIPQERLTAALSVFQLSVCSLFMLIIQIPYSAAIVAHENMGYYAIVSMTDAILKLLIAITLPFVTYDKLIIYGIMMFLISVVNFLFYYIYAKRNFEEIHYRHTFFKDQFKCMLTFSGWNVFGSFAYTMQGQGLNMLMNAFFGPVVNAARGVAYQVQSALSGFTENIAVAFKPQLVESYANQELTRVKNLMYSMSKLGFLMVFLLALPISLEINYILNLWLDGTVPEDTEIFTILILLNMALGSLNIPISQTVQAVGSIMWYQIIRSGIVMSVLPISWIALRNGAPAYIVFVILVLINFINQPISLYLLRKIFPYSYREYIKTVILPCLLFSILTPLLPICTHLIMDESFIRVLSVGFISLISSAVVSYIFVLSESEKIVVKAIFNKISNRKI